MPLNGPDRSILSTACMEHPLGSCFVLYNELWFQKMFFETLLSKKMYSEKPKTVPVFKLILNDSSFSPQASQVSTNNNNNNNNVKFDRKTETNVQKLFKINGAGFVTFFLKLTNSVSQTFVELVSRNVFTTFESLFLLIRYENIIIRNFCLNTLRCFCWLKRISTVWQNSSITVVCTWVSNCFFN